MYNTKKVFCIILSIFTAFIEHTVSDLRTEQVNSCFLGTSEGKENIADRSITGLLWLNLDWAVPLSAISFGRRAAEIDFSVCNVGGSNLGSHRGIGAGVVYIHGG